eukprot:scaffold230623_cov57-Attheya_sp.AAC.7
MRSQSNMGVRGWLKTRALRSHQMMKNPPMSDNAMECRHQAKSQIASLEPRGRRSLEANEEWDETPHRNLESDKNRANSLFSFD